MIVPPAAEPIEWPPPIIPGAWRELGAPDAISLAARLGNALGPEAGRMVWHILVLGARATPLSFYRNWLMVEFAARLEGENRVGFACFLYGPGMRLEILDFSSAPIHAVNGEFLMPLSTPELAADYLRFFCAAISGEDGRFQVVESDEDLRSRTGLGNSGGPPSSVTPLKLTAIEKPDVKHAWKAEGFVLYGHRLVRSTFEIADGQIEMTGDGEVDVLPVQPEQVAPPFRYPS